MATSPREMTISPSPSMVGSPSVGPAPVQAQARQFVPFRIATLERSELIGTDTITMTTAEQVVERVIESTGFMYSMNLQVVATAATNSATVVFFEDGPWSALSALILKDVTGELVNCNGYDLNLAQFYGRWVYAPIDSRARSLGGFFANANTQGSGDANVFSIPTLSGSAGGSFTFFAHLPVALNRRSLIGVAGNQDRAQQYTIRHNLASGAAASSGPVYTTAPTNQPSVVISRIYESYAVPNALNDSGIPNQVVPGHYGTLHFLTKTRNEAAPAGPGTVNHFLRRLGNTTRLMILVLRSNGTRATAESNMPTNIIFKVGNQTIFNETVNYRRHLMFQRYGGIDAPNGVLVYDFMHDFAFEAGSELGHDWLWTQNVTLAQFQMTYPSGMGTTNNSLDIITSDLIVPQGAQIYGQ